MKQSTIVSNLDELAVIEAWRVTVEARTDLDTGNELDWYSMSIGFFLAHLPGTSSERIAELAVYARYTLQIG